MHTIDELAHLVEMPSRTIRFYNTQGLLPSAIMQGRIAYYDDEHVVVLTLINTRMLTPDDFLTWRDACQLTEEGRWRFFVAYEQRKATLVSHPVYGYRMSYSRMLEVQARMLAAYVRGSVPAYTGFTVR